MELMELRRGLMSAMANGADYIKGAFTVPNDASSYILNFGKTFASYLFLIEMDDTSKTTLVGSGESGNKLYAESGIYPLPSINNTNPSPMYIYERINPSTQDVSATYGYGAVSSSAPADGTKITFSCGALTAGTSYLYRGYTYKYYIVAIK